MPFLALAFELGGRDPDAVEATCFAHGALAVTLCDARDDPILEPAPGETRLWPATRLEALFQGDTEPAPLIAALAAELGLPPAAIEQRTVEDRAWEREWMKDFQPMRFGARLWVCPRHGSVDDRDAVVLRLDPGLAFGTGTHPTTALCLEWLDANVRGGEDVIDYGCGSGILAIAAVLLGARRASCFDIDPQALLATHDNAQVNGVEERVLICAETGRLPRGVDLLLANILAGPLCELAPRFAELVRPGGTLVLAGLMEHQANEVAQAQSPWFDITPFGLRDGWVGLQGTRRP
ncbi:MAG: 50S ribosomal protein L11 methyltransferase [Pseudomonadota bacterium]|jgi:ribosomal protein L11 methyltransferase|nr:MAG: 50S ribosomal protein L11 methyltransferase [Pseudomonadota bacterium]